MLPVGRNVAKMALDLIGAKRFIRPVPDKLIPTISMKIEPQSYFTTKSG